MMMRVGVLLTALAAAMALTGAVWTPYPGDGLAVADRLQPPSPAHWLGTDALGRDLLSRIMQGAGVSLGVAFVAMGLGLVGGLPIGLLAAAVGGRVDDLLMRASDLVFAFPALVIAILITAVFGPSAINAMLAIALFNIPVFAKLVRGAARPLWQRGFVLAARMAGKSRAQISLEHILPHLAGLLAIQGSIQLSLGILAEAGLSYVGLGLQPPTPSLGRLLADGQTLTSVAPWLVYAPGLTVFAMVLGINLLGDGLRLRRAAA